MKLQDQVVSLELAKKLKELGVEQESHFYHEFVYPDYHSIIQSLPSKENYSAYTVAELGEMLPGNDGTHYFVTQKGVMGNLWYCTRKCMNGNKDDHKTEDKNEANARAQMLIYLIENNLLDPVEFMTNEDKLQDEFMQFWDDHKDTLGLGNYSDEVKRFWLEKIKQAEQRGAEAERKRIEEDLLVIIGK